MQFKTFGKNAFFIFASQAFGAATTLIIVPFLARYLGVADYGRYAYVYAFVGLFETLSVFGLHSIFVREVARRRGKASIYLGNTLQIKAPMALGAFLLILLASTLFIDRKLQPLILICAAEVLLRKFFMINIALGRAFERMEYEFLVTVLERTVTLTAVLLTINFDWGLIGIFLSFFLGAVAHASFGTLLVWNRLARPEFTWVRGLKRSLLSNSWPLGLSQEAEVLYNRTGTVFLGQWHAPDVVGTYSGGYRIYQLISQVIGTSIAQSSLPTLAQLSHEHHQFTRSFRRIFWLNTLLGILLVALTWSLAPIGVRFLLGPEFELSIPVLRWISLAPPFSLMNRLLGVALQSADRQQIDGFLTTGAFLVNLALNLILVPSMAAMGAVWALLGAELLLFGAKGVALAARRPPAVRQEA